MAKLKVSGHLAAHLLVAVGVGLSACGQEVEVSPAPPKVPRPQPAPAAGGTAKRDPLARVAPGSRLTITVRDDDGEKFRYSAPRSVRGGLVDIRLLNKSTARRKAQLWRIVGDHTIQEALRAPRPRPAWLQIAGGVSYTLPRQSGRSLQVLQPGRYYVANEAGDPGIVASFMVIAPAGHAPEPPGAPARIEARDYSFRVSGLRPGRNSIDLENVGAQPHHAFFAPLRKGADIGQVRRFFSETNSIGAPPVDSDGSVESAVLAGGERQVLELDLRPGRYALVCFVTNNGGGPQHIELGMINEVRVRR